MLCCAGWSLFQFNQMGCYACLCMHVGVCKPNGRNVIGSVLVKQFTLLSIYHCRCLILCLSNKEDNKMLASIVLSASFFRSEWKERKTIEEDDLQWIIEKYRSDDSHSQSIKTQILSAWNLLNGPILIIISQRSSSFHCTSNYLYSETLQPGNLSFLLFYFLTIEYVNFFFPL